MTPIELGQGSQERGEAEVKEESREKNKTEFILPAPYTILTPEQVLHMQEIQRENARYKRENARYKRENAYYKKGMKEIEANGQLLEPTKCPDLAGFDIYGKSHSLDGSIGGDHIIFMDFKDRYDYNLLLQEMYELGVHGLEETLEKNWHRAGILLMDVTGHQTTDSFVTGMFHQAFMTGAKYELLYNGKITRKIFEVLNDRFFKTTTVDKTATMVYGEILEDASFRFLNAGHPLPIVFSNKYDKFMDIGADHLITYEAIALKPSQKNKGEKIKKSAFGYKDDYEINEIHIMGQGDILLLYSDGLEEHTRVSRDELDKYYDEKGDMPEEIRRQNFYFPYRLEEVLKKTKHLGAKEIYNTILDDVLTFGPPTDDISHIVIKKA